MAPKHCFWPTTQWVIRSCLEIIYLIPDLSCVSALLCDREREGLLEVHSFLKRSTKITHLLSYASIVPYLCNHVIFVAVGCLPTLIRMKYTGRKTMYLFFPANINLILTQRSNLEILASFITFFG